MAFLVKPVFGEAQRMEMAHIQEALKNGIIAENWLVRDERQDFWYSVGKLVGKVTSQPVTLFCPHCQTPTKARRIDIGLPVACSKCAHEVIVPDPDVAEERQRDEIRFDEVRQKAIFGGVALAVGVLVTLFTYFYSDRNGFWILWWGPLAIGGGTFAGCFPQYLELKRKLRKPK
ncbi:MAG: hypothetical protein WCK17_16655 [Verrucomicrobiota bacterium]